MRLPFLSLLAPAILVASSALAGGLGEMTDAERTAFQAEVRAYLMDHPEVIMEAVQVLQDRQNQTATAHDAQLLSDYSDKIFNDPNSWAGGNPDGDITVVEFMDYRCTYCRKAYEEVEDLVKTDGNIRFVLKEFPILGDDSVALARFAIAVRMLHGDEAYKKAHDALIVLRGTPEPATLGRLASDLGLEAQPILDKMDSDEVTAVIAANHALAGTLNITGTPTFVINKTMVRGYLPEDDMRQIVEQERAG